MYREYWCEMPTISTQPSSNIHQGHVFRGSYLQECARVEAWACEILRSVNADAPSKTKTYLFGQELKALATLASQPDSPFRKPERVKKLLADFEPFAKLRSELAHAVMQCAEVSNEALFIFELPTVTSGLLLTERKVFRSGESDAVMKQLHKLAKEIADQKLLSA